MGILTMGDAPEVWCPVPGFDGFEILVKYLDPPTVKALGKTHTEKKLNRQTRQMEETMDQDAFSKAMTRKMIRGWRGLTIEVLDQIVPLPESIKKELREEHDGELPFSEADAAFLADHAYTRSFMDTVMAAATDLEKIRELELIANEKN